MAASNWANLRVLSFSIVFGLLAGAMARRAGGLFPAIVLHACNNLLVCLVLIRDGA